MGNFITGLFTLLGAFGGIYLKDYLEQKNTHIKSTRQKAVEAYALTNKLPYTLIYLVVLCKNSVANTGTHHTRLMSEFENKTPEILEKLELIIIEHFLNLSSELSAIKKEIYTLNSYLIKNILTPSVSEQEVEEKWQQFQSEILSSTLDLNSKLLKQYINIIIPKRNFYLIINKIWCNLVSFFSKPKD